MFFDVFDVSVYDGFASLRVKEKYRSRNDDVGFIIIYLFWIWEFC